MKSRRSIRGAVALALVAGVLVAGCGGDNPEALVASAKEYLAKNDRSAAMIQLKNALQKNPDSAEARFLLGRTLLETGDLLAAEKELRRAAELKYPYDQVAPPLARSMVLRGDFKNAIDEFSKAEIASPQGKAELQTALGMAWLATGNVDAARSGFAASLAAVPGYPPALLGDARTKATTGDMAGASTQVQAALAAAPTLADAWVFKGDLAAGQGAFDEALASYRKALEIRPTFLPAHARLVSMLLQQGKNDEASAALEAMKKVSAKHPQTLYLEALYNFRTRNYAAARDAIQLQLRTVPDNPLGLLLSASIDMQLQAYAQAEASLQKVLQRMPKNKFARMQLVSTYARSGQPTRALEALKPLLAEGGDDSDIQALAGEVYMQSGDTVQAARYFQKAAALDPKNTSKRTSLALSHMAAGDSDQGLRELQDAAAADTSSRADLALVSLETRMRRYDAALDAVAALEKKQPGKPLPHNLRAGVLLAKGDSAGARKSFEQAAKLDAGDFTAAQGLAKLDIADNKPEDAKKRYEAVLAKDPKNAQAMLAIAEMRIGAGGAPDEIVALIGKAIAADPTNPGPRQALITYYLRIKEPAKAVAAAQDALAAIPDNAELMYAAGQAQQAAGEPNQAAKSFNKLVQMRPGSPVPYMKEAESQILAKDYEAGLASLKKALALKPDLIEAQRGLISVYLAMDNVPQALAVAREVQTQRPKESVGYLFEAEVYITRKAWNDASVALRKGLAQVGTTDLAVRSVALSRAAGKDADADKFVETWLKDHPKDRDFRSYLAEAALAKGDFAGAASQYKTVLELKPDDALALNNLAWVSGKLKDPKAIEYAEKADKLVPNSPAILDTLGVLQVEKGEVKRGVETLKRASAMAPSAAGVRLNLARALIKDGQKDAAKKELETIAKLGDSFPGQAEVTTLMQGL